MNNIQRKEMMIRLVHVVQVVQKMEQTMKLKELLDVGGDSLQGKDGVLLVFNGRGTSSTTYHNLQPTITTTTTMKGGEVTCKNSKLQESLKDVIDNWHTEKDTQTGNRDWNQVWEEILQMVEPLSKYISKHKESMEKTYCNDPKKKESTWTEADRNACMLITAGLKHIYEIKEDPSHKRGGPDGKKNNRTFRDTAACIILNELIRKLKEKANSCTQKISIEEGIKQAFEASPQIKATACKGDPDCFECKQQNYSDCKMGNEQVRVKLRGKLDSDAKINEALEDIYPPSNPTSISGTATLTEWFTRFSNNVSEQDNQQYEELGALSALCEHNEDDEDIKKLNLNKYGEFCNIMMKNIMLVTGVPKEYKNKGGQTPCQKKVKNIPLCDLLKVWMWYMHWFCVPKEVIEHAIRGVKEVRTEFINKGVNYMECSYDVAFKIPYGGKKDMGSEAYDLFGTSTLYHKIEKDTNKTWCENNKWEYRIRVPKDSVNARADEDEDDRVISSNDNKNNVHVIMDKIEEGLEQEEGGGGGMSKPGSSKPSEEQQPQPPASLVIPARPPPPPPPRRPSTPRQGPSDAPCTDSDLCQRAQCVTTQWFKDRKGGSSAQNWCAYWEKDDVGGVLKKLSEAMKNESTPDDNLCEDIGQTSSGTEDSNKKACQYITRGLRSIYNFKERGTWSGNDADKKKKNTQQFDRTMGCIFLNLYADTLENKDPCNPKTGVDYAFNNNDKIKKGTLCESDNNCVTCTRDKSYEHCTLNVRSSLWTTDGTGGKCNKNGNNMKGDMDGMLEGNVKIKETQNEICQTTPPPKAKEEAPAAPTAAEAERKEPAEEDVPTEEAPTGPTVPEGRGQSLGGGGRGRSSITKHFSPFFFFFVQYFGMLRKTRKRYRRAPKALGPSLEQQVVDHVDEQADGPHDYYIVKKRKPRSTPIKRKKKRVPGRRHTGHRGVRRRMIIDIHLEILDECQKGDLHLRKEDFFEILVKEFMGSEFIKEKKVPCSDFRFGQEDFVPMEGVLMEHVPSLDSGFREGRLCS
ncbi:SICA antigen [Plasmodium coatneyi]|uniref:SICA antigen n=1 Tax=Plasmodium coatneyi TaxID=208452 RepID=A0A1B1DWL1_9APIC|nr:SICA antigen [Plasmodium coatneyi]ANQ07162.1 SICA antigen [Plasmodium coatneyi]